MTQAEMNRVVFDALAARKSINIDNVGVIYTSLVSGDKTAPKFKNDFIRYEILFSADKDFDIDLKAEIGEEEFLKWQSATIKISGRGKTLNIDGVGTIKIVDNVVKKYILSPELELQLNPLGSNSKHKKNSLWIYISATIVVVAALISYFSPQCERFEVWKNRITNSSNSSEKNISEESGKNCNIEYSEPTGNEKLYSIEKDSVTSDSTNRATTYTIPHDTITTPKVMEVVVNERRVDSNITNKSVNEGAKSKVPDGVFEPQLGKHYLVAGSFKTLEDARRDAARLMRLCAAGTKISTTTKADGGFINFLALYDTYDEAYKEIATQSKKHPKIKGIWVYTMGQ